jgi:hypothetical protein
VLAFAIDSRRLLGARQHGIALGVDQLSFAAMLFYVLLRD